MKQLCKLALAMAFIIAFTSIGVQASDISPEQNIAAQWIPNAVKITFNSNGGGTPPHVQVYTFGIERSLPGVCAMEKISYNFLGWAETANATAAMWLPGATSDTAFGYADETKAIAKTLYAVWEADTTKTSITDTLNSISTFLGLLNKANTPTETNYTNASLVEKVNYLESELNTLKSDVATTKSNVATIKSDVATNKTNINTIKTNVNSINETVGTSSGSAATPHYVELVPYTVLTIQKNTHQKIKVTDDCNVLLAAEGMDNSNYSGYYSDTYLAINQDANTPWEKHFIRGVHDSSWHGGYVFEIPDYINYNKSNTQAAIFHSRCLYRSLSAYGGSGNYSVDRYVTFIILHLNKNDYIDIYNGCNYASRVGYMIYKYE